MVVPVERDRDLRPAKGLNRVPEHRVDVAIVQLDAVLAGWHIGASDDDVDNPFFLLEGIG